MRTVLALGAAAAMTGLLPGCASAPKPVAAAQCPAIDQWQLAGVLIPTVEKAFGKVRLGYHLNQVSRTVDAQGNVVVSLDRIGPASADMPEPGEGKKLVVVVKPCTGDLVRYYQP